MRSRARMWAAALAMAGALGTGGVAQATTWTVTNYADPSGGSCPSACSLRHAVSQSGAGDTIHIPAQNGLPVSLSLGAPIVISHALTITGDGADASAIDGSANLDANQSPHRIFTVQAPLQLSGLTLSGANASGDDTCSSACATLGLNGGGAILNSASLTLDHVRFTGDSAAVGGAVSTSGTLTMTDVEFAHDDAAFGGGLFVRGGTATGDGISLHDLGTGAFGGGAAFVYRGSLALTNSTIADSGWASSRGGGIENAGGALTLTGDTLTGNLRGAIMTDAGATTEVGRTIIGAGFADGDDWACVPAGRPTSSGPTTAAAITRDDGGNLDEDGHCGLTDASDRTGDANLAPVADNGGPTPTAALLHGSPALDALALCSGTDQRGVARPQGAGCDIGAFEAVRSGAPTATTQPATDVGSDRATLTAAVALSGEAGGAYFEYGTAPDALDHTSAVAAAGQAATASLTLDGLSPGTTYYFRAVAANASGTGSGDTLSFTTAPAPPAVYDVTATDGTDTTASIRFTLDPGGAATRYVVRYGLDAPTQSTAPVDVPADAGPQQSTVALAGLTPGTTYQYAVVATNSAGETGADDTYQLTTDRQVQGVHGEPVTVTDSGDFGTCPAPRVDWGDGSDPTDAHVDCYDDGEDGYAFDLTASHAYAEAGHYRIVIDYGEAGQTREWAQISGQRLTVTTSGPGSVTGDGIDCPDECTAGYDTGTEVALTPQPDDGATFLGWSGACGGDGACTVTLDQDRDVTARFAGPPVLADDVAVDPVTDTTAQLHFRIDPNGSPTTYVVHYGTAATYGQSTAPVEIGSDPGAQDLTATLTGLAPGTDYHYEVVATNDFAPAPVSSGDELLTTEPQLTGLAGKPIEIGETGSWVLGCPTATVDWGDGTTSPADIVCDAPHGELTPYTLTASHAYATAGHYPVEIEYEDGGGSEQWALIAPSHALTVTTSGDGAVSGDGISCPADCANRYAEGAQVTLTATPAAGRALAGWDGACSGTAPTCTVTLDQDRAVTATFVRAPVAPALADVHVTPAPTSARVDFSVDPGGSATSYEVEWGQDTGYGHHTDAGDAGSGFGAQPFSQAIAGLQPRTTYHFRVVASNAQGSATSGDATFTTPAPPQHTLTVAPAGAGSGTVTGDAISCPGACAETADEGTRVTLSAHPDADSVFTGWSGACTGTGACTVTLDQDRAVTATFARRPPAVGDVQVTLTATTATIDFSVDAGGSATQYTLEWGATGSYGDSATGDGGSDTVPHAHREVITGLQPRGTYHFHITAVSAAGSADTGDRTLTTPALPRHTLSVATAGSGSGTVTGGDVSCPGACAETADEGTRVTLSAQPDADSVFTGWSGACTGTGACTVTLDQDRAVTAEFALRAPAVALVKVSPTATTAVLSFTIDAMGSPPTDAVDWGVGSYEHHADGPDTVFGFGDHPLTYTLQGLQPGTTYQFRVTASNGGGDDDTGATQFTTLAAPAPAVSGVSLASATQTSATVGFTVDPAGSPATYVIEYGETPQYGQTTAAAPVDSASGTQALTRTLTGLQPGRTYHYRVLVTNAGGTTDSGDRTFTTAAAEAATPTPTPTPSATPSPTPTPTPTPVFHQAVVVRPVSGTVLVRRKGSKTFVPLDAKAGVPLGSQVDVTHGRIALTSVPRRGGKPQTAQFYAGIFTVTQPGAITQLTLSGPKPTCAARGAAAAAAKRKNVKSRQLWGNGHGSFRTAGQYSAATVRGTQWLVQDTCAGTLTRVAHGLVAVTDHVRHKTVLVRGGKSYLARPRRR